MTASGGIRVVAIATPTIVSPRPDDGKSSGKRGEGRDREIEQIWSVARNDLGGGRLEQRDRHDALIELLFASKAPLCRS